MHDSPLNIYLRLSPLNIYLRLAKHAKEDDGFVSLTTIVADAMQHMTDAEWEAFEMIIGERERPAAVLSER